MQEQVGLSGYQGSPLAQQRKYDKAVQLKFINDAKPYAQEKKGSSNG